MAGAAVPRLSVRGRNTLARSVVCAATGGSEERRKHG